MAAWRGRGLAPGRARGVMAEEAADITRETMKDTLSLTATLRLPEDAPEGFMDASAAHMLFVKVGLLEQDLERFAEGIQGLVGEAEGVIGGIFERVAILHARTARVEAMLGLPVFGEDDEEAGPNSPRPGGAHPGSPRGPRVARGVPRAGCGGPGGRTCRRGHPLRREESSQDDPPRVCGFCRRSRPASHVCSEGSCYFSACADCCADAEAEPRLAPETEDEAEDGPRIEELVEGEELPSPAQYPDVHDIEGEEMAREYFATAAAAAAAGACGVHGSDGRVPSECGEDNPLRRSWPAGPESAGASARPSAVPSGRASPVEDPAAPSACGHGAVQRGASFREPATPSTDIPMDETRSSTPPWASDDVPLPPGAEDCFGGGRRRMRGRDAAAGAGAGEGGLPMKVRLAALESEVRELERRLAEGPSSLASPAAVAPRFLELEEVVSRMLGEESLHLREALRQELEHVVATACTAAGSSVKSESKAELRRASETLRGELCAKLEEVLAQVQAQQLTFSSAFEAALKKDLRGEFTEELRQSGGASAAAAALQLAAKLEGLDVRLSGELQSVSVRLSGLEVELPRCRVRATAPRPPSPWPGDRAPSPTRVLSAAAPSGEVVEGLAQGVTALARVLGLMAENEGLGDAEGWLAVGRRLEKAWSVRARDFWQFGVPGQLHLFDILCSRACASSTPMTAALSPSAASPSTPDRREGARLASRLAAAVAFGSSQGSPDESRCSEDDVGPPLQQTLRRASSGMMSPSASTRSNRNPQACDAWGKDPFSLSGSLSAAEAPSAASFVNVGIGRPPTPQRSARRQASMPGARR